MIDVMYDHSSEYRKESSRQGFELAFPCESPKDVEESFNMLISKRITSVHEPQDMTWNQRTALFADPDVNIHEIFAEIK